MASVEADAPSRLSSQVLWGLSLLAVGVAAPLFASVAACSPTGSTASKPQPATAIPGDLPPGPPPPNAGLPMPVLAADWQPPSAVAGDPQALATAVSAHPRVGLAIDPGLAEAGSLDAPNLAALIGKLAPGTAIHPIHADTGVAMGAVVLDDPPLLPTVAADGRTTWATPQTLGFDRERLRSWSELGDPAVLLVGPVGVDNGSWRELASGAVGSCEPLMTRLLEGQAASLELLDPFLDHADAILGARYLGELAQVVPELEAELEVFAEARIRKDFDDEQGWARYQCGQRYRAYLEPFADCVAGGEVAGCSMAPRLFLSGAARIGSLEPSDYIPADCPERLGRDYVEALRAPARAAAEEAGDQLDPRWMILAERLATLSEVHGALGQLCTPARRRFAASDVEALQAQVAALGELYRRQEQPAHDARFLANDGSFRVAGLGMVRQLARYDAGSDSAARALVAGANELRGFARAKARCSARPGTPPLMTLLVNTAEARVELLGFAYAEELWCDDLGPL